MKSITPPLNNASLSKVNAFKQKEKKKGIQYDFSVLVKNNEIHEKK